MTITSAYPYRKKPVVVNAIPWRGDNCQAVMDFMGEGVEMDCDDPCTEQVIIVQTLHDGPVDAERDDWIIKGPNGDYWPCKPDIFEASYEPVEQR